MTPKDHVTPATKSGVGSFTLGHKAILLALVYSALTACATSLPANVESLKQVVGTDLPGAQGNTLKDQDRIDSAVAGLCGAGIYGKDLCDIHTKASASRLGELR